MPLDSYVTLGRSGLRVSPFCLGTMTFGEEWGFGADARTSTLILDHYLAQGGNFLDTANLYTRGHSERILGDYWAQAPQKRRAIVLATKFSANMFPGDPNGGGANRKAIVAACDASLERLQTDYIDLYWQHWDDPFTPFEETLRALDDLVRSGRIRYIGFSDMPAWKVAAAQVTAQCKGWAPLIALQIEYSLLERTVEGELIPMAQAMGLGVTPWGPLRAGMLSGKYSRGNMQAASPGRAASIARNQNERVFGVLDTLAFIARRRDSTVSRVALAWLRAKPGVAAPIIGARTLDQLKDNIEALELTLEPEDIVELDAISAPSLGFPSEFLPGALAQSNQGMTINGRRFGASPR